MSMFYEKTKLIIISINFRDILLDGKLNVWLTIWIIDDVGLRTPIDILQVVCIK